MLSYYNNIGTAPNLPAPTMPQAGNMYGRYGGGRAFDSVYAPMRQEATVELNRMPVELAARYYQDAARMRDSGALAGLQLLERERQNAMSQRVAEANAWRSRLRPFQPLSGLTQ